MQVSAETNFATNLLKIFECPVSLKLMDRAVVLNCGHSFQDSVIKQISKNAINDLTKKICPSCRTRITLVTPNYTIRAAVELLSASKDKLPEVSKKVEDELKKDEVIPYPGKSAKFELVDNNAFNKGGRRFETHTKDSFFTKIEMAEGYGTKTVVFVSFKDGNYEKIKQYFEESGIFYYSSGSYLSIGDKSSLKKLCKILLENNEFAKEDVTYLKKMLAP